MKVNLPKVEPCIECPYPTNFMVNTLTINGAQEKYAVHCRECNDSWIEEVNVQDEYDWRLFNHNDFNTVNTLDIKHENILNNDQLNQIDTYIQDSKDHDDFINILGHLKFI